MDDKNDCRVIGTIAFWYSHQYVYVRWQNTVTDCFHVGNGTIGRVGFCPQPFLQYTLGV